MMTPITLVMPYYENAGMLRIHYDHIKKLPDHVRAHLSVVIVDDGSPKAPAFVDDLNGVNLQLYRLKKDVRWNQDACRNIGVKHAETNWVLMTDIDHVVSALAWQNIITRHLDPTKAYTFTRVSAPDLSPYKPHPNTYLLHKATFEAAGGYDERFAGYYGTDSDFANRLWAKAKPALIKEPIIRYPRTEVADASTTTYLRKQPEDRDNIARIKQLRAKDPNWVPLRDRFEYDRIWP